MVAGRKYSLSGVSMLARVKKSESWLCVIEPIYVSLSVYTSKIR